MEYQKTPIIESAIAAFKSKLTADGDPLMPRERAVIHLMRSLGISDPKAASEIENRIHDEAWRRSLRSDDASMRECSHDEHVYDQYYRAGIEAEISQPR